MEVVSGVIGPVGRTRFAGTQLAIGGGDVKGLNLEGHLCRGEFADICECCSYPMVRLFVQGRVEGRVLSIVDSLLSDGLRAGFSGEQAPQRYEEPMRGG